MAPGGGPLRFPFPWWKKWSKKRNKRKKTLDFTWISTEFKVGVCDTILLSYAFWGMLSCIYWFAYQCIVRIHLLIYKFIYIILLIYTYYLSEYAFILCQILCYLYSKIFPHELGRAAMVSVVTMSGSKETVDCILTFEGAKGWTKTCNRSFYDYTPRKLTAGYPNWWLGKGNSIEKMAMFEYLR